MTQHAHTPGPWGIGSYTVGETNVDMLSITALPKKLADGTITVTVVCQMPIKKNGFANARLIAAAPAMLEVLRKHEARLSRCASRGPRAKPSVSELNEMLEDFHAATALATGSGG